MAVLPYMPSPGTWLLCSNMREARSHGQSRNMALPPTYYWFYQMVRNHGPWDYKQQSHTLQNFGNFNFGAAGFSAGIPANTLLIGAGWAQSHAKTSRPNWGAWYGRPPYGDDPHDQFWIKQGIDYALENGY
ncbi:MULTISPECIES: polymorphic toxin type 44 domain-containing protein [Lelliottia]|uniref:Rhs-Related protein n=1 Tax=Lelliottia aquatilis TaxID=2080838 RepID=A0ABX4ZZQ7_9ENTR|nr:MULTISPECIES: polymorphic toxin type 44 domain-containing protein [Lelliottia]NTZ47549.1 Rhs-Related protein [Lelliottia aquatilis]POZ16600.1 Rhs-Related protein [Lelliottia sp. 7254-16]POZ20774.1 Rhs-Related protein [Lelliottia aquatilis]POZ22379.1 Rhs-Related protein [Lelliottia aquatilis]POZ31188.1 Rhs-Related protein [Lelliottia aquatilis]